MKKKKSVNSLGESENSSVQRAMKSHRFANERAEEKVENAELECGFAAIEAWNDVALIIMRKEDGKSFRHFDAPPVSSLESNDSDGVHRTLVFPLNRQHSHSMHICFALVVCLRPPAASIISLKTALVNIHSIRGYCFKWEKITHEPFRCKIVPVEWNDMSRLFFHHNISTGLLGKRHKIAKQIEKICYFWFDRGIHTVTGRRKKKQQKQCTKWRHSISLEFRNWTVYF